MDETQLDKLAQEVRLMVQSLRPGWTDAEKDAACRAIHSLYSNAIKSLVESNAGLHVDNAFLQRHILRRERSGENNHQPAQKRIGRAYQHRPGARCADTRTTYKSRRGMNPPTNVQSMALSR